MKKDIHPKTNELKISCSTCNTEYTFRTTVEKFSVDVCSSCHPFFTGDRSLVRATGRVDQFNRRLNKSKELQRK
ncbi:50S ribosomal protein L31 [Mycoplasma sp. 1654_15]|uniref:50S ribosomal protein L31 n=1 Tax=Mycoplasma sp. 1654_15 TaxID=2725994 RepID=UPI00144A07FE|nr:50S ribosomal protein L31 [Mycoplasma sp. 1654_15]QJB71280.1 50S ribosomal protein L31 [Mycoplasma sp. 1654_15]